MINSEFTFRQSIVAFLIIVIVFLFIGHLDYLQTL